MSVAASGGQIKAYCIAPGKCQAVTACNGQALDKTTVNSSSSNLPKPTITPDASGVQGLAGGPSGSTQTSSALGSAANTGNDQSSAIGKQGAPGGPSGSTEAPPNFSGTANTGADQSSAINQAGEGGGPSGSTEAPPGFTSGSNPTANTGGSGPALPGTPGGLTAPQQGVLNQQNPGYGSGYSQQGSAGTQSGPSVSSNGTFNTGDSGYGGDTGGSNRGGLQAFDSVLSSALDNIENQFNPPAPPPTYALMGDPPELTPVQPTSPSQPISMPPGQPFVEVNPDNYTSASSPNTQPGTSPIQQVENALRSLGELAFHNPPPPPPPPQTTGPQTIAGSQTSPQTQSQQGQSPTGSQTVSPPQQTSSQTTGLQTVVAAQNQTQTPGATQPQKSQTQAAGTPSNVSSQVTTQNIAPGQSEQGSQTENQNSQGSAGAGAQGGGAQGGTTGVSLAQAGAGQSTGSDNGSSNGGAANTQNTGQSSVPGTNVTIPSGADSGSGAGSQSTAPAKPSAPPQSLAQNLGHALGKVASVIGKVLSNFDPINSAKAQSILQTVQDQVAKQTYQNVAAAGIKPTDLLLGSPKYATAWKTVVDTTIQQLKARGMANAQLDSAFILALARQEQGEPGRVAVSGSGVQGPLQVTRGTAIQTFGRSIPWSSGTSVDSSGFARGNLIGSVISGAIIANAALNACGGNLACAAQTYNSGSPTSCRGGSCVYGAHVAQNTIVMRNATVQGGGNATATAAALGGLTADRPTSVAARADLAAILTGSSVGTSLAGGYKGQTLTAPAIAAGSAGYVVGTTRLSAIPQSAATAQISNLNSKISALQAQQGPIEQQIAAAQYVQANAAQIKGNIAASQAGITTLNSFGLFHQSATPAEKTTMSQGLAAAAQLADEVQKLGDSTLAAKLSGPQGYIALVNSMQQPANQTQANQTKAVAEGTQYLNEATADLNAAQAKTANLSNLQSQDQTLSSKISDLKTQLQQAQQQAGSSQQPVYEDKETNIIGQCASGTNCATASAQDVGLARAAGTLQQQGLSLPQGAQYQSFTAAKNAQGTYTITNPTTGAVVAQNVTLPAGSVGSDGAVQIIADNNGNPLGQDGRTLQSGAAPLGAGLPQATTDPNNPGVLVYPDTRPVAPTPPPAAVASQTNVAGGNVTTTQQTTVSRTCLASTNPIIVVPCGDIPQQPMLSTAPVGSAQVQPAAYQTSAPPVPNPLPQPIISSNSPSAPTSTPPAAVVSIIANPKTVHAGTASTISWSSVGAVACLVGVPGQVILGTTTSGTALSMKLSTTTLFVAACVTAASTTVAATTTVIVR